MIKHLYILLVALFLSVIAPTSAQDSPTSLILYTGTPLDCDDEQVPCEAPYNLILIDPRTVEQYEIEIGLHDPSGITWSDDSEYIVHGRNDGIYLIEVPYGEAQRIIADATLDFYSWSAVSPDSQAFTYLAGEIATLQTRYDYRLYITSLSQPNSSLVGSDLIGFGHPVWSPDSRHVLFPAIHEDDWDFVENRPVHIYKVNAETSEVTQLTQTGVSNGAPHWSTDGNRIAYSSSDSADGTPFETQLMVMDIESGETEVMTEGPGLKTVLAPWSADDQFLIYSLNPTPTMIAGNDDTLYLLNVETGEQRVLATSPTIGGADWSPDGTQMVYSPGDGRTADICIITLADGSEECLGVMAHWLAEPLWRTGTLLTADEGP